MKQFYIPYIILPVFILCIHTACDDENADTFNGSDAFITSFQLEKAGEIYEGIISGTSIIVKVPSDASFTSGVTPSVTLSENASISPDPTSITNWEENEQFIVRAYDGTTKTYTYGIQREVTIEKGVIRLETQQEVDQFVAKQVHIVEGSLIIGKESLGDNEIGISNISGLSTLQQVTYDLIINPGYIGEDLNALNNIQLAGSITIQNLPNVKEIEWSNLQKVVFDLSVSGDVIESINFPELSFIGRNLELSASRLIKCGFNYLQQVGGNMDFPGFLTHPLESISFPFLQRVDGAVSVQNYPALVMLDFPVLTFANSITVNNLSVLKIIEFPALADMGNFTYNVCSNVTEIKFPILESLTNLYLVTTINTTSPALENIEFPSLKQIRGAFTSLVYAFINLPELYFPVLEQAGLIDITTSNATNLNNNIEAIRMPALCEIQTSLGIGAISTAFQQGNISLTTLDFSSLVSVPSVLILNQKVLKSFVGFENLFKNSVLPEFTWNASGCGYPVTYEQMMAGKYTEE